MKIKRKFCRNVECDNCGVLLTYYIDDINVARDVVAANKFFYIQCMSCNHTIDIGEYSIPRLTCEKLTKLYLQELNGIKSISSENS